MELAEFVSKSLVGIVEGVREANQKLKDSENGKKPFSLEHSGGDYKDGAINFDVAVTAGQSGTVKGGAGVSVWAVKAGGEAETKQTQEQVSRIQFKVDINYILG